MVRSGKSNGTKSEKEGKKPNLILDFHRQWFLLVAGPSFTHLIECNPLRNGPQVKGKGGYDKITAMKRIGFAVLIFWQSVVSGGQRQFDPRFHQGNLKFLAQFKQGPTSVEGNLPSTTSQGFDWVFVEKEGKLHFLSRWQLGFLTTGEALRDSFFQSEVFQSAKYREVRLKLSPFALPVVPKRKIASAVVVPVEAELQWRDKRRNLAGQIEVVSNNKSTKLTLTFRIKLSEFRSHPPAFQGATLDDTITWVANFILPL